MSTIYMVDSIESPGTTGAPIPQAILDAPAIAGYLHGNSWPTYEAYAAARPELVKIGRVLSITLSASFPARCLDMEAGGANASQAPGWVRNSADRSNGKPVLYTFASNVDAVISACNLAGVARDEYFIWAAHFTYTPHICAPNVCGYPQADGTQYTNKVAGNCDGSIVNDYFFKPISHPKPPEETVAISTILNQHNRPEVFVETKSGEVFHTWEKGDGAWEGSDDKKHIVAVWHSLGTPGK